MPRLCPHIYKLHLHSVNHQLQHTQAPIAQNEIARYEKTREKLQDRVKDKAGHKLTRASVDVRGHKANMRVDGLPEAKLPQTRIAPRLDQAIQMLVHTGCSIREAAESTGYNTNSLTTALKRPHVIARKRDIIAAFMQNGQDLCRKTLLDIVKSSKSDGARIEAIKTFLTLTGDLGGDKATTNNLNGDVIINYLPAPSRDDLPVITIQPVRPNALNVLDIDSHSDND